MDLPSTIQELLRDEAYVCLCREAVEGQLAALEQQKVALAKSRPPFGVLRRKASLEGLNRSMQVANATAEGFKERLDQLGRFNQWLQHRLRGELSAYLGVASGDYQRLARLQRLLHDWQQGVQAGLQVALTAFSREMRELRHLATDRSATRESCTSRLKSLRAAAEQLELHDHAVAQVAVDINRDAQKVTREEVRAPTLPAFRRTLWVDWLCVVPLEQLTRELTRVESEVDLVVRNSIGNALSLAQTGGECCARLQNNLLLDYWSQLRIHAQTYYVEECDVDSVLGALAARYDPEIARRPSASNPTPPPPATA